MKDFASQYKDTILIVDDVVENIDVLKGTLSPKYKVKAATSGAKALEIANKQPQPDLILLDVMMPEMNGYDVCRTLKSNPVTRDIPVVFVTAKSDVASERTGLETGAVDYISKPVSPPIVKARVRTHLELYHHQRTLEAKVSERTRELEHAQLEIVRRLASAAEFKDEETGNHVIRMSHYSRILAHAMNMNPEWVDRLFHTAPMHDVGKIGIPDHILLKRGKLTAEEWTIMRQHTIIGAQIVGESSSPLMQMAREVAVCHHEKWDGSGYPKGLKGEEIPISGRIVAVADVFDALTSERPYKEAWPVERAVQVITENSGQHFDPNIIPIFLNKLPEILKIKDYYQDEPGTNTSNIVEVLRSERLSHYQPAEIP